jgi:branched-chain amino acid transport system ATP-binding protein
MLMDEPSAGLGPALINEIFKMIRRMRNDDNTILLIEQNVHMALAISDFGYRLKTGRIVLEDAVENLVGLKEIRESLAS